MMQKDYLKFLISESKKFSKKYDIFDIILYGSSIKGKEEPRDIDIMLIFRSLKLDKRLEISHEFKENIKKNSNLDVKSINLEELFDKQLLARQSIITEGYSLLYNKSFANRLGFEGSILFTYSLKNLDHNTKTKFTYSLIGRNTKGIIKTLGIKPLGKGCVIAPIESSMIFEDFLNKWNVKFNKKIILISEYGI